MQNCKTTVVIPNYNGMKYIRDCLDSLKTLREESSFHIIVVDNGSKDGSLEVISEEYPEVELIPLSENTGFCHAVNVGIQAGRTPYVLLLNNDTKVLPGFIVHLEEAMEESENIFSVNPLMLTMQDENIVDNAGIRYCALGWAYDRGKGNPKDLRRSERRSSSLPLRQRESDPKERCPLPLLYGDLLSKAVSSYITSPLFYSR